MVQRLKSNVPTGITAYRDPATGEVAGSYPQQDAAASPEQSEIHRLLELQDANAILAQQASDWYALYADRATKERAALKEITSLRNENAELRQLLQNMEAARDFALKENMRLRNENFALRQLAKPETRRVVAESMQKLGARLAELLDEDQWAECEGLLLAAGAVLISGESHGHC